MPINEQITDSISQISMSAIGGTPAQAMATTFMPVSNALGNAAHNTTAAQFHAHVTMQAATVQGINSLLAVGTSVAGRGANAIIDKG